MVSRPQLAGGMTSDRVSMKFPFSHLYEQYIDQRQECPWLPTIVSMAPQVLGCHGQWDTFFETYFLTQSRDAFLLAYYSKGVSVNIESYCHKAVSKSLLFSSLAMNKEKCVHGTPLSPICTRRHLGPKHYIPSMDTRLDFDVTKNWPHFFRFLENHIILLLK